MLHLLRVKGRMYSSLKAKHSTTANSTLQTVKGLSVFVDHQLREGCKIKTTQYPCKFCDAVFFEKKLLIAHKRACTEASLINGAYECDICGRRYSSYTLTVILLCTFLFQNIYNIKLHD